nr:DEAD/DEAH box helicase [Oceanococcus sp. HetDA_MAG_MS8]
MVTTIWGATNKPLSSQALAEFFEEHDAYQGFLYIGYPIIGTPQGPFPIDALWVSEEKGAVIFNLVEGVALNGFQQDQDDSANKLEAKFRSHRDLMKGRNLAVELNVVTFAPAKQNLDGIGDETYAVCNFESLSEWINGLEWIDSSSFPSLLSVIQSISTIRKGKKRRDLKRDDSRGAKLKRLEDSIANLDNRQGQAVIETVAGVQRIRGLAGSGKTIVLALKAAYLHAQHPDWKIAVTFHTRSLKDQFKQLINTFSIEQTNEEPDWSNLHVIHAWGAPGGESRNGIYYSFCQSHGIEFHDFKSAKYKFGSDKAFEGACDEALKAASTALETYDAILVDEAQDLTPPFLQICYQMLKGKKRLVYAYDELQSLTNRSLPPPEEIFGEDKDGQPLVRFEQPAPGKPKQDIILEKCYRNSRPVLATAHALGFGIYRVPSDKTGTGLIQMFDQSQLWLDVGYEVVDGALADGQEVTLARGDKTSPEFLESHSSIDDLISFVKFESKDEQAAWLAREIRTNVADDELQPDDIIVINPDPLTTRKEVGKARKLLYEMGIESHLAGVDTSPDVFFDAGSGSITFTGIFRAKGNEAGMVYIINAQDCFQSWFQLATVRNRLFTAITRSKAWVRVLGVGEDMNSLIQEFQQAKERDFRLHFRYPDEEQRKRLTIVNRDLSVDDQQKVRRGAQGLESLIASLEAGTVFLEDLPDDAVAKLKKFLSDSGKS